MEVDRRTDRDAHPLRKIHPANEGSRALSAPLGRREDVADLLLEILRQAREVVAVAEPAQAREHDGSARPEGAGLEERDQRSRRFGGDVLHGAAAAHEGSLARIDSSGQRS
jgi:hypothetical protein